MAAASNPNAEPELLAWHAAFEARGIAVERLYWGHETQRLWYAAFGIADVVVEIYWRMASVREWPGFIVAIAPDDILTNVHGPCIDVGTPSRRQVSLVYAPSNPPRWLMLTTGFVGTALLDEISFVLTEIRLGRVQGTDHDDRSYIVQDTRRQYSESWRHVARCLRG